MLEEGGARTASNRTDGGPEMRLLLLLLLRVGQSVVVRSQGWRGGGGGTLAGEAESGVTGLLIGASDNITTL